MRETILHLKVKVMSVKENTLQFLEKQILEQVENTSKRYNVEIVEFELGEIKEALFFNSSKSLDITFTGHVVFNDNKKRKERLSLVLTCAYKTPKGYISTKNLPVEIKDVNDLTVEEISELIKFNTDAVRNTFDPFWKENEAKRRNAIGWAGVVKHLQSDVGSN